jgi:hypothetical protein
LTLINSATTPVLLQLVIELDYEIVKKLAVLDIAKVTAVP